MMKRCSIFPAYYACAAALAAACGLAGCGAEAGDGLPREAVSGGVTVDGKPLASGIVLFLPVDPNNPTQGNFTVVDGKYGIAKQQGLVPGNYTVKISSSEGEEKKESESLNGGAPGMPPAIPKDSIPAMYNTDSKLAAEVKAGIPNDFQFALSTSKPTK